MFIHISEFTKYKTDIANIDVLPKLNILVKEIEKSKTMKILVLANVLNYFECVNDENKNIFVGLPVNVEFAENLRSCLLNSSVLVVVLWGFAFDEESEKYLAEGLEGNKIIRFLYLR